MTIGGALAEDWLFLALTVSVALVNLSILGWMFIHIDRVIRENGSLDLYWNFVGRSFGWQLLILALYWLLSSLV